jgi:hypothetical protein
MARGRRREVASRRKITAHLNLRAANQPSRKFGNLFGVGDRPSRRHSRWRVLYQGRSHMEPAIKKIVDTYVRLKNRRAIEDLLIHRRRLALDLKSRKGYDFSRPIAQIDEEIAIIEAALDLLEPGTLSLATRSLMSFAAS